MRRTTGRIGGAAALVIGLVATGATPLHAQEAVRTCNGQAVTIAFDDPGVGLTITGTNGRDVILGGPGNEVIKALSGEDVVCAGEGDDTIDGGPDRDELLGQGGSDTFKGRDLGQDLVTGGSREEDVARYRQLPAGVTVDLSQGVVHMTSAPVNGGILGIETVIGTAFADVLTGRSTSDAFDGGSGDDTLDGRGGSNALVGGPGRDTVTYASAAQRVDVNLATGLTTRGTTEDAVIEVEVVIGSPFGDRLTGTSDPEQLSGGGGDDTIKGKGGDDILQGGNGDDVLFPGGGDDFVDGGANDPVTSSGEHGDLVSYQGDTLDPGATHLEVVLSYFIPTNGTPYAEGVGDDSLSGIESARGVKDRQNTISGDDGPNVIIGGDRQDALAGRGGNDLVYGLAGVDSISGDYPGGMNPGIFGDDYLDAGAPTGGVPDGHGGGDADVIVAGGGDDTCTGAVNDPNYMYDCETVF